MSEIEIKVVTNVDKLQHYDWPRTLPCRPMVGDMIRPIGHKNSQHTYWKITSITFLEDGEIEIYIDNQTMRMG